MRCVLCRFVIVMRIESERMLALSFTLPIELDGDDHRANEIRSMGFQMQVRIVNFMRNTNIYDYCEMNHFNQIRLFPRKFKWPIECASPFVVLLLKFTTEQPNKRKQKLPHTGSYQPDAINDKV